jgi:ABC-type molybdate transport system ATPase subunit
VQQRHIGYVFQDSCLFSAHVQLPTISVLDYAIKAGKMESMNLSVWRTALKLMISRAQAGRNFGGQKHVLRMPRLDRPAGCMLLDEPFSLWITRSG